MAVPDTQPLEQWRGYALRGAAVRASAVRNCARASAFEHRHAATAGRCHATAGTGLRRTAVCYRPRAPVRTCGVTDMRNATHHAGPGSRRLRRACIGLLLAAHALAAGAQDAVPYRLVGYVAGWETAPPIAAEKLSAVNYAFAHVDDSGRPVLDQAGAADFLAGLRALKQRNPRLRILVSVGGWGADGFSDAAHSAASRARFAHAAAALVAHADVDGIDLDWEYPGFPGPGIVHRASDARNFTLLLRALREQFDRLGAVRHRGRDDHYLLTAALADREFVAHVELDRIHRYLDWINLMSYDFHNSLTPTTGHHAGLRRSATAAADARCVECAVRQYLAAGVPARKLVVGVPFYGRAFADVTPGNHGLDQPFARYEGDHPWSQLVAAFIGHDGFERYWDDRAKAPYLWNAQAHVFVSYDDPQSLALKAAFVREHQLGGIMYWEQSQDPHGELLDVLARALH
jgi:chitinase